MTMPAKEAAKVLRSMSGALREYAAIGGKISESARQEWAAIDAAVAALESVDTIIERARELIGLHMSEQEGMMIPTRAQFQDAVDALAQAIGAADQHPRERDLAQDAMK